MSPTYDSMSFTTCELPAMSHGAPQRPARRQVSARSTKRRSLPYASNGEGYGSQQSLSREASLAMQRRPSAPLPGSMPPPHTRAFGADSNDEDTPAQAEAQQSSDVETAPGERRLSLL